MVLSSDSGLVLSDVLATVGSACFFKMLHALAIHCKLVPSSIPIEKRFLWFNILLSLLHAIFSSVAFIVVLVKNPHFYSPDNMKKPADFFTRLSVFVTLGYFVFDSADHLRNFKVRKSWVIVFHHIMIFIAYWTVGLRLKHLNALAAGYPAEINTVCLQIRLLLRFAKVSEYSLVYRSTATINMITFLLFRFPSFAWIFLYYYWYVNYTKTAIHVLSILIAFGMNLFNIVLFGLVVNTDYIEKAKTNTN